MQTTQSQIPSSEISPHIHWGHFGTVMGVLVLLIGMTWLSKPELFSFKNNSAVAADPNTPHYYAYVPAADDLPQPEVLGASTDQGPSIINEDGSVSPADTAGQVLGANTNDPQLSLDSITVVTVPDSDASIKRYLSDDNSIETAPIESGDFEAALSSGDQNLMNQQAAKLTPVRDALQKLKVPAGFATLQKLKIIQYNSAIALLQNFGQLNQNPDLVGQNLQDYLTVQQQLADEINSVAQKYNLDPNSIGPAGETAVLAGAVQGASQGVAAAASALSQQASSTPSSLSPDQMSALGRSAGSGGQN